MTTEIAIIPTQDERNWMKELGAMAIKSRFLPTSIDTIEKAVIIQMYARTHQIDPMVAFSEIYVVKGRPSMSVKLKIGQIPKRIKGAYVQTVGNPNPTTCTAVGYRPGRDKIEITYTIGEAKAAGFLSKDNWKNAPAKMLMWRACGAICDIMFADIYTMPSYHPDDLEPIKIDEVTSKPIAIKKEVKVKKTPAETLQAIVKKPKDLVHTVEEIQEQIPTTMEECEAQIVQPEPKKEPTSFEKAMKDSQTNFFAQKNPPVKLDNVFPPKEP